MRTPPVRGAMGGSARGAGGRRQAGRERGALWRARVRTQRSHLGALPGRAGTPESRPTCWPLGSNEAAAVISGRILSDLRSPIFAPVRAAPSVSCCGSRIDPADAVAETDGARCAGAIGDDRRRCGCSRASSGAIGSAAARSEAVPPLLTGWPCGSARLLCQGEPTARGGDAQLDEHGRLRAVLPVGTSSVRRSAADGRCSLFARAVLCRLGLGFMAFGVWDGRLCVVVADPARRRGRDDRPVRGLVRVAASVASSSVRGRRAASMIEETHAS